MRNHWRGTHNRKEHHTGQNKHHFFKARSRGGNSSRENLLWLNIERHQFWHRVFGNMGAEEVLRLLERVVRAKKGQRE